MRTPQGERLELVVEFSTLQAGDLVVYRGCIDCGGTHRYLLLRKTDATGYDPRLRQYRGGVAWRCAPEDCQEGWNPLIDEVTVSERRLYRVIIPPPAKEQEVARDRELERTR